MSRRRKIALIVGTFGASVVVYGTMLEPHWLHVRHHKYVVPANVTLREPFRIAHLSDLHAHDFGRRERAVLEVLDQEKPDMIVITGDTVDDNSLELLRPFFYRMSARMGIWTVRGNWEHWSGLSQEASGTFYRSVATNELGNTWRLVSEDVVVVGLEDQLAGHPDADEALGSGLALRAAPNGLRIGLFHEPTSVATLEGKVHLGFSGHTHGGQIRLPWIGPLWRPPGSGNYDSGRYEVGPQLGPYTTMFVSRGIGTSRLPIRLLCPPEVLIVDVIPHN